MSPARRTLFAAAALVAFAANSLLCRVALQREGVIDPWSFTVIRIIAGAVTLLAIVGLRRRRDRAWQRGSWTAALALFIYAIAFSVAYVRLGAGTGALILFAAVQITMITAALRAGERFHAWQWLGLAVALAGLVVLVTPGLRAPHPVAASSMAVAGLAWGVYSLRGRGSSDPITETCGNFVRAVSFAIVVAALALNVTVITQRGVLLAIASGSLASGVGYSIWYAVVPHLRGSTSSIIQLLVPIIAAAGGVVLLGEALTLRFFVATAAIIGGIALVVSRR